MNIRLRYINKVKHNCTNIGESRKDVLFWRNKLFATTIIYLLPLCVIALIPGIYLANTTGQYVIGIVDILTVSGIIIVALAPGITVTTRKILFISSIYLFSFAMLYYVGLNGPGMIYLLTACIFSILIFSTNRPYWSACINTFICILFAFLIRLDLLTPKDHRGIEEWIAVSSNLIFVSFLFVVLIPRLFENLQEIIDKQEKSQIELKKEKKALDDTTNALQHALNSISKIMDSSPDVICTTDAKGHFVKVSAACEKVLGYIPDELIGKPFIDFVYMEDKKVTDSSPGNTIPGIHATNIENRYVHKNGSLVPLSWSVRWDENDQVSYNVARDVTEKRRLEKAFEIERQSFYDLFLEAPLSMAILNGPDHIFEVANPLYLKLIGKKDIIGKAAQDALPEIVEQGFIEILDNVYKTGKSYSANEMLIKLDFEGMFIDKYLNFVYRAYKNSLTKEAGILLFAVDVTEQVLSRKKIEESELRLNEAQHIAKVGNWEVNLAQNAHYWSDETYKIFGVSKEEIVPSEKSFMSFFHPEDLAEAYQKIDEGFKTSTNISFDFRFIRKDGTLRYGYNQWKFKFNKFGMPEVLFGILQDVTDRKESEQLLRNSEAFSRGVLDSLSSNIAVIDSNGIIIAMNESWKLFGLENSGNVLQHTGIGANYYDVCSNAFKSGLEGVQEAGQGIKDVMAEREKIFYLEYPCHSSAKRCWYSMRAMKFDGNQPMVVISHQDISERKFAESERRKIAKDLVQRNADLEQFTYIVSHNLRAPVANILGIANILNRKGLIQEEKEKLGNVLHESVNKLDTVVKDLNKILQIKGMVDEQKEIVHFSDLIKDIKISINNLIDGAQVVIQNDFNHIDRFLTLKSYMYSIFYNLITNSIKYRQPQFPSIINISSRLTNNKIELIFGDNGMGIDMKKRSSQVFGLYKRFHPAIEGKGMGLFMVKTQVEKLGGRISINSEVNIGTEFRIEFDL